MLTFALVTVVPQLSSPVSAQAPSCGTPVSRPDRPCHRIGGVQPLWHGAGHRLG